MKQPFQEGFITFKKEEDDENRTLLLRKPTIFISKSGYAILNNGATRILLGKDNTALRIAFNPHTNTLALKPEREHVGYPETVKVSRAGGYRRAGIITFKNLAGLWKLELTDRRYSLEWNKRTGIAEVDLNNPLPIEQKFGLKGKRIRRKATKSAE